MPLPLLLACVLLAPPSAAHLAPRQDPAPIVDERPELKTQLDTLATHLKARGEKDPEAIGVIDALVGEFTNSGPKDRAAVVKALGDCFDVKRTKELEEGIPDDRLYNAAAVALGTMGPESVKPLVALIGDKAHKKNLRLQQNLTLALGKTKSPDGIKTLLGLLKHKDAPMQAAGAEALANYHEMELDTRKAIFDELLKTLMDQNAKKLNVTDQEAQERWNVISGPIMQTLQKLSGNAETDPDKWQRWWNDNKKKDWAKAG
jgi:hypothetical protein